MKLLVRRYNTPWRPMVRYACAPSWQVGVVAGAWLALWVYFIIGAAVLLAIENPARQSEAAIALGQTELSFLDAIYFTDVYLTTCGFGDVIPLTGGGRAFVALWSFFGTALWLMFISTLVSYMGDWIYVHVVLNARWHLGHARRHRQRDTAHDRASVELRSDVAVANSDSLAPANEPEPEPEPEPSVANPEPDGGSAERDIEASDFNGEGGGRVEEKREVDWNDLVEGRSVQEDVLSWYALAILNISALLLYFVVHLIGAGVLFALEAAELGNLTDSGLTPVTFGNTFYLSLMASQTICFGVDYNPKTSNGRAFFVAWHQFALISSAFLFVTVLLALLRWTKCRLFAVTEKVVRKTHGLALRHSERRQLRRSAKEKRRTHHPTQASAEAEQANAAPAAVAM